MDADLQHRRGPPGGPPEGAAEAPAGGADARRVAQPLQEDCVSGYSLLLSVYCLLASQPPGGHHTAVDGLGGRLLLVPSSIRDWAIFKL